MTALFYRLECGVICIVSDISFRSEKIFPMSVGHNAIFVWNQDEVPQNSRYAKSFFYYKSVIALKQLRHLAVRVRPISRALRACFLGHYRMARMSQSASSSRLASWMRPHMVPDTYLLKFLFAARYTTYSCLVFDEPSCLPLRGRCRA